MRDVIIIGGGLSGTAAAYRLHAHGVPHTIIELKPRLGGSIGAYHAAGFTADTGRMFTLDSPDDPLFATLGLRDALHVARTDDDGVWVAFRHGQQALVDALSRPLTGQVLYRMAVTSAGEFDAFARAKGAPNFCVCLENGTVIDSRALIIAAPARHAGRILRSLSPAAAATLDNYRYDTVARVSLGFHRADVAGRLPATLPAEYPLTYVHTLDTGLRVPTGGLLIQAGIRFDPAAGITPETGGDAAGAFSALFDLPESPLFDHVTHWPEDEPLMWLDDDFPDRMQRLHHALPDGAAIAGSDYIVTDHRPTLADRVRSGFAAADRILATLK